MKKRSSGARGIRGEQLPLRGLSPKQGDQLTKRLDPPTVCLRTDDELSNQAIRSS